MLKQYELFVLETNERMIINNDIKKQYDSSIQEYVKEHYLEGCKNGSIKPVPLKNDKHILFINIKTPNKELNVKAYFKCLSFAKFVDVNSICFIINNEYDIPLLNTVLLSWKNTSYLDYHFNCDIIFKHKIQNKKENFYHLFETGFIQEIYFNTYTYLENLHKDNILVRNEDYPKIKLNKDDKEIIEFYFELKHALY